MIGESLGFGWETVHSKEREREQRTCAYMQEVYGKQHRVMGCVGASANPRPSQPQPWELSHPGPPRGRVSLLPHSALSLGSESRVRPGPGQAELLIQKNAPRLCWKDKEAGKEKGEERLSWKQMPPLLLV